jgi:hypothetical protein
MANGPWDDQRKARKISQTSFLGIMIQANIPSLQTELKGNRRWPGQRRVSNRSTERGGYDRGKHLDAAAERNEAPLVWS